jgi:hypothetical protein
MTKFENLVKFSHYLPTCLRRWKRESVPKRRHIKFRCWGITQKKKHNKKKDVTQILPLTEILREDGRTA